MELGVGSDVRVLNLIPVTKVQGVKKEVLHLPGLETVLEKDKSRHACKENSVAGT